MKPKCILLFLCTPLVFGIFVYVILLILYDIICDLD